MSEGIRALAAGPDPAVGHEPGLEEALDPGPGKVHPPDVGELRQDRAETARTRPVHPHEALGLLGRDDTAPGGHDRVGGRGPVRDDGDAGARSTHGAEPTAGSGRGGLEDHDAVVAAHAERRLHHGPLDTRRGSVEQARDGPWPPGAERG